MVGPGVEASTRASSVRSGWTAGPESRAASGTAGPVLAILSGVTKPPTDAIECLKDAGRQSVWLVHRPGGLRTVKAWTLGPVTAVKMLLGIAQPQRQERGARRLEEAGVKTPRRLPPRRVCLHGLLPIVRMELEYIPGVTALAFLADDQVGESVKCRWARAVGQVVAKLIRAKLFNRDLKLTNLIVASTTAEPIVWIIDPVGVRRMRSLVAETERMLERLAVEVPASGVAIPSAVTSAALRSSLRPLAPDTRRAVLRRLRERRRRESGQSRSAGAADRRSAPPAGTARRG